MRRWIAALTLVLPAQALAQGALPRSCLKELGPRRATQLVERCTYVSPATHPPCNVSNPCDLIRDEIVRSCHYIRDGGYTPAPSWCAEYETH